MYDVCDDTICLNEQPVLGCLNTLDIHACEEWGEVLIKLTHATISSRRSLTYDDGTESKRRVSTAHVVFQNTIVLILAAINSPDRSVAPSS